jgi:preprotein translocase subunit SecE
VRAKKLNDPGPQNADRRTMKEKIIAFFNDVIKEMKKVTWPTQDELKESTFVVLATTILFAVFVFLVDTAISEVLNLILGA